MFLLKVLEVRNVCRFGVFDRNRLYVLGHQPIDCCCFDKNPPRKSFGKSGFFEVQKYSVLVFLDHFSTRLWVLFVPYFFLIVMSTDFGCNVELLSLEAGVGEPSKDVQSANV